MNPSPLYATPYPEVNAVLDLLLAEVGAILGDALVGLYLYGSLSSGDFDPGSSDIDFAVVTADELPPVIVHYLKAMHARIAASGHYWATRLEGSYFPRMAFRRHDPANARHPSLGLDWPFGLVEHGSNWILERQVMRESGVAVWGPPPHTLIDAITPCELRAATIDCILGFWTRQLDGPAWLRPRHYQAFAILTMCRALYTLACGAVASKPVAAAWALRSLEPHWAPLIERALVWRHDEQPDNMGEMLNFVRYTIEGCRHSIGHTNGA